MTTAHAPSPYTALPDEQTIADTIVALEEHGFSADVVDDLDAAVTPFSPASRRARQS
jgi:hypothetical protein